MATPNTIPFGSKPLEKIPFGSKPLVAVSDNPINNGLKKPYIPTLPEKGVLAPTPIGKTSVSLKDVGKDFVTGHPVKGVSSLLNYGFQKATGVRPADVGREAINILGTGEMILGTALGGSAVPFTKDYKDLQVSRQKEQEINNKLIATIKTQNEAGKDTKRLRNLLVNNLNNAGASDEEVNQALQLTSKQIIGGGIQTALDVATAGTASKLAQTGKLFTPAEKILTKQTIPTILGQFKVGLKSAIGGGVVGYGFDVSNNLQQDDMDLTPGFATILGAGIPLVGKVGQVFSKEQKLLRKEGKIGEIIDSYRQAVNPLKSDIRKIEVKGGKDLDDILRFMAEEEVLPRKDTANRLDTKIEAEKLVEKKSNIDTLLAESLDDTQQINDLNQIRIRAKKEISQFENNAEILKNKEQDIDNLIDSEIERYGRSNLTDRELHDVKNGMWSVGFDMNRTTKSPSAKKIGNIMKNIIQDNNASNFNVQEMNNLSSQYRGAIDLLESVHGNVVQGGKLGGFFYRMLIGFGLEKVLGGIPGLKGVSFFLGQFIGKHYNDFINDPERIINSALKEAKKIKLDKRSEKILNIFSEGLKNKRIEDWNGIMDTKLLPAPSAMIMPEKTGSTIQKEISSSGIVKNAPLPTLGTPIKVDPLIQEAKKYKSAEEFVKAQPTLYHGGSSEITEFKDTGRGGVFLTPDKKMAEIHAQYLNGIGEKSTITEAVANPKKIYKIKEGTNSFTGIENDNLIEQPELHKTEINKLKEKGFDAIQSSDGRQLFVFDPKKVQTKSQLTDIWNKANKK